MTTAPTGPRPSVVTWGATAGVVAGLLLVVHSFDQLASLRSLDSATSITNALNQLGGNASNLGSAFTLLHGTYIGVGAASGLAAVLAAYAYFGNRSARAVLTPVAAVLFVVTASLGWTLGIAMAAVVGLLWSPPARAWYAGGPASEPTPTATPATQLPPQRFESFGAKRTRPRALLLAAAITWVLAGVSAMGSVLLGLELATSSTSLDQLRQQLPGLDQVSNGTEALRFAVIATVVLGVVLAVVEVLVATFVLQGSTAARTWLTVFAALGIGGSLLNLPFGFLVMLPWITVLTLLHSPDAKAWFAQIRRDRESR